MVTSVLMISRFTHVSTDATSSSVSQVDIASPLKKSPSNNSSLFIMESLVSPLVIQSVINDPVES